MARYHNSWRKLPINQETLARVGKYHEHVARDNVRRDKVVKISYGKVWESEFAPTGWRFKTPFEAKEIFNNITRKHKSARDSKKRFGWNAEHKFWSTQDVSSKDEAVRELEQRGYTVIGG